MKEVTGQRQAILTTSRSSEDFHWRAGQAWGDVWHLPLVHLAACQTSSPSYQTCCDTLMAGQDWKGVR